jgi:hypothetical protein
MLWLVAGLVSCAIVLWHLNLILMLVCLNKLVIFHVWQREGKGCPFCVVM